MIESDVVIGQIKKIIDLSLNYLFNICGYV